MDLSDLFLGVIIGGTIVWTARNFLADPIVDLHKNRRDALYAAERFAYVSSRANIECIDEAKSALYGAATALRVSDRANSQIMRLYCNLRGYELGMAASALIGLGDMTGDMFENEEQSRKNNQNLVYRSLNAHQHISSSDMAALEAALIEHDRKAREKTRK